jgi:hypothetical protein
MIIPFGIDVVEWASQTSTRIEAYGIIPRIDRPDEWVRWANDVVALPGIEALNPPDPDDYANDWQTWAALFNDIVRPG